MYLTKGWGIPFMMQAWWLFVICAIIYFGISYLTPRPLKEVTDSYTWDSPLAVIRGKITKLSDVRVWTIILIITLIILYTAFS
jgi:SSS family solute:Na+ symporter